MASAAGPADIHLSIVSHGHGDMVAQVLRDLASCPEARRYQVTLVHNLPEGELATTGLPFPVAVVTNPRPLGFGANHNRAFRHAPLPQQRRVFVVLNPDVRLPPGAISALAGELDTHPDCGIIAPGVLDSAGRPQLTARPLPGIVATVLRFLRGHTGRVDVASANGDQPDWVAGMLMMFPVAAFTRLGGFDEAYHLYYEDVDICSRAWLGGYTVRQSAAVSIVHDGQWQSRRLWQHLRWHVASALRCFTSTVYWRARFLHRRRRRR